MFPAVTEAVRTYGRLNGLLYLVNRFFSKYLRGRIFLTRYTFLALPTDIVIPAPRRLGQDITTQELRLEEITRLNVPRPDHTIAGRFAQGSRCLGAFRRDEFLGFIWLQDDSYLEDEVRVKYVLPTQECAWDYDLYIDPKHRSTAAFLKLWSEALADLRQRGKNWSFSRVSAFAPDSLRAHLRMGAYSAGNALFVSMGSFQVLISSLSPHLHLSRGTKHVPALTFGIPEQD